MPTGLPMASEKLGAEGWVSGGFRPSPSLTLPSAASLPLAKGSNSDCGENVRAFLFTYTVITLRTATWLAAALTLKARKTLLKSGGPNFFKGEQKCNKTKIFSPSSKCVCFTAYFYNIPKTKRKKVFFHSFSVIDTQTRTYYVFVSLSCHLLDSETITKCFCFTLFSVIWQWNKNKMFLFRCTCFLAKLAFHNIRYQKTSTQGQLSKVQIRSWGNNEETWANHHPRFVYLAITHYICNVLKDNWLACMIWSVSGISCMSFMLSRAQLNCWWPWITKTLCGLLLQFAVGGAADLLCSWSISVLRTIS